ncbi:MAG: hypothetical protein ABW139_07535 [Candidatus Thiodiazotropha sp. DIVDIV]
MESEFIAADGTLAEADASTYLKRVLRLSSLPAIAGGLWRFAPLPGFSFTYRSLFISTRKILGRFFEFHFGCLRPRYNIVTSNGSDGCVYF